MLIGWDNLADIAVLDAASEYAEFPIQNVQHPHLSKKWKAAVPNTSFTLDMGATVECSLMALLGTNLTPEAQVLVRASDVDPTCTVDLKLNSGWQPSGVNEHHSGVYKKLEQLYWTSDVNEVPAFECSYIAGTIHPMICDAGHQGTFTRNSTAWSLNSSGYYVESAINVPRFERDSLNYTAYGIRLEKKSTNYLLNSADLTQSSWAKGTATISTDGTLAPDGVTQAQLITATAINGRVSQDPPTGTADVTHTLSWYVKRGNCDYVQILIFDPAVGTNQIAGWFNLANGTVGNITSAGSGSAPVGRIKPYRDDWYRVQLSGIISGITTYRARIMPVRTNGGVQSEVGDSVYAWQGQFETKPYASSPIITGATPGTREVDVLSYPPAVLADAFGESGEGTVVIGFRKDAGEANAASPQRFLMYGAAPGGTDFYNFQIKTDDKVQAYYAAGGVTQALMVSAELADEDPSVYQIFATAFKVNDFSVALDGGAVVSDTGGVVPDPSLMTLFYVGGTGSAIQDLDGTIAFLILYPKRLPNSTLQKTNVAAAYRAARARYWKVNFNNTGASSLEVGRVFLGPHWEPEVNQSYDWSLGVVDESRRTRTHGGQLNTDKRPKRRYINFALDWINEGEAYESAYTMTWVKGTTDQVLVVPDITSPFLPEQAVFGNFRALDPVINHSLNYYRQRYVVEEAL